MRKMTQSDIMGLAAEANLWVTSDERLDAVKKFAALVAESNAKLCEEMSDWHSDLVTAAYKTAADSIRESWKL